MGKGAKKHRKRAARPPVEPVVTVPRAMVVDPPAASRTGKSAKLAKVKAGKVEKAAKPGKAGEPTNLAAHAHAATLTGAKKIKKKCCRSTPRCKGCPVVLMRAARLQEAGVTGKDLKKAVKRARAA